MEGGFFLGTSFKFWPFPVLELEPTEGSSSGKQPASEKPDQSEWESSSAEQGEPAFKPVEPARSVCKQMVCLFLLSRGPLGWGTKTQGLRCTTLSSPDEEALNSCLL